MLVDLQNPGLAGQALNVWSTVGLREVLLDLLWEAW